MSFESPAEREDALKVAFGSTLGRISELKGVTREQLAEHVGKKKENIAKWFLGDGLPTPESFELALEFLSPPEEDMITLKGYWEELQSMKSTRAKRKAHK